MQISWQINTEFMLWMVRWCFALRWPESSARSSTSLKDEFIFSPDRKWSLHSTSTVHYSQTQLHTRWRAFHFLYVSVSLHGLLFLVYSRSLTRRFDDTDGCSEGNSQNPHRLLWTSGLKQSDFFQVSRYQTCPPSRWLAAGWSLTVLELRLNWRVASCR